MSRSEILFHLVYKSIRTKGNRKQLCITKETKPKPLRLKYIFNVMSNFRQKLNETLYLSVDGSAGVRGIMLVYTSLVCDPPFFFLCFVGVFFPFQLCSQQMVIIMFVQINEY